MVRRPSFVAEMNSASLLSLSALAFLFRGKFSAMIAAMVLAVGSLRVASLLLLGGAVAATALHEVAHAVPLWAAGQRARFGVAMVRGVPVGAYCRAEGPVPRRVAMVSLVAPQVAVPLVAVLVAAVAPQTAAFGLMLCILNAIGSVADFAVAWSALRSGASPF